MIFFVSVPHPFLSSFHPFFLLYLNILHLPLPSVSFVRFTIIPLPLPSFLPLLSAKTVYLTSLNARHYGRKTVKSTSRASYHRISTFSPDNRDIYERKVTGIHTMDFLIIDCIKISYIYIGWTPCMIPQNALQITQNNTQMQWRFPQPRMDGKCG
jgi:hypothetical protein